MEDQIEQAKPNGTLEDQIKEIVQYIRYSPTLTSKAEYMVDLANLRLDEYYRTGDRRQKRLAHNCFRAARKFDKEFVRGTFKHYG